MEHYFIFKTDNKTGETMLISTGCHETKEMCESHWNAYSYGFMDGACEELGGWGYSMTSDQPMRFNHKSPNKDVDFFMLLNDEGHNLVLELSK